MKKIKLVIILLFTFQLQAQNSDSPLPPNPERGKCYIHCNDDNSWQKINCNKLKELSELKNDKEKIKNLQKELLSYGFDVDINGSLDKKTILSYGKFDKEKIEKKRRKEEKKRQRQINKEKTSN